MEKEGLGRVLNFLHHHELSVSVIVTDRRKQINKWLRETHPDMNPGYCSDGNISLLPQLHSLAKIRTFLPSHPQHDPVSCRYVKKSVLPV